FYQEIIRQRDEGYDDAEKIALKETELADIEDTYDYVGEHHYYIFFGKSNDDKKIVVFQQENDNGNEDITLLDQEDIVSEEANIKQWEDACPSCRLMSVKPAMIDDEPLWELTYKDDKDRLVLDYRSIKDGSGYEKYRFNQMFK